MPPSGSEGPEACESPLIFRIRVAGQCDRTDIARRSGGLAALATILMDSDEPKPMPAVPGAPPQASSAPKRPPSPSGATPPAKAARVEEQQTGSVKDRDGGDADPNDRFTVHTTVAPSASFDVSRAAALSCRTFFIIGPDGEAPIQVCSGVPFDEARARRAFDLIERLITGDNSLTPDTLGLFEAAELVEVALFLDHGKLLRLLQKTVARSLGRLNDAKAVRAALKITSDESETEMAARREPLFRPASGPSALPEAPASSANEASVPGPSRSLSSVLRTGDAIEVCLHRCSGASLRKLLGVSRAWAQRARNAANSPKWIGAQASSEDSSVAEIEWALQSPVEADLGELISRLPDGVTRLNVHGKRAVDAAPLLAAQRLDSDAIDALQAVHGEAAGRRRLQYAAALLAIKESAVLTELVGGTFRGCTWLTKVRLPRSLTSMGDRAFLSRACRSNFVSISGTSRPSSWRGDTGD